MKFSNRIAITGMACWFPGAKSPQQLWENCLGHRREFRKVPDQILPLGKYGSDDPDALDRTYAKEIAVIDGFKFDRVAYRIPQSTYDCTDIVHWLSLEVAHLAIKDAGYSRDTVPKIKTGVILGNSLTGEMTRTNLIRLRWPFIATQTIKVLERMKVAPHLIQAILKDLEFEFKEPLTPMTEESLAGALSNTISGRVANYFNFDGGGYTVDGACASSLLAVYDACQKLAQGDFDLALAGGVDSSQGGSDLVGFARAGALTRDDLFIYDQRSSGFISGEGCGVVILKRLEDAIREKDKIYSVICGWGMSSDGKSGIMQPTIHGQAKAISRAYEKAGYGIETVQFFEGHGTGTRFGDEVELKALASVLNKSPNFQKRVGIGSLKSLIGHTKSAAGVAALIKATIASNRRVVPPTIGCEQPHVLFQNDAKSLYPLRLGKKLNDEATLRIGISAMGFGGINTHVTIESSSLAPQEKFAPQASETQLLAHAQRTEVFVFGASSEKELIKTLEFWKSEVAFLSRGELIDLSAHLLSEAKKNRYELRCAVIAERPIVLDKLISELSQFLQGQESKPAIEFWTNSGRSLWYCKQLKPKLGFIFPGQGSHSSQMTYRIFQQMNGSSIADKFFTYSSPKIRQGLMALLEDPDPKTQSELEQINTAMRDTALAQPAICLTSWLNFQKLKSLGLTPQLVAGHSLGELTAMACAGVLSEDELAQISVLRGQAMGQSGHGLSGMLSLMTTHEQTKKLCLQIKSGYVAVANRNSPEQIVVAGELSALNELSKLAMDKNVPSVLLPVGAGFHSQLMEQAALTLGHSNSIPEKKVTTNIPFFSCVTGCEITGPFSPKEYLLKQMTAPVDFEGLLKNISPKVDLIVEIGPGKVLSKLFQECASGRNSSQAPVCLPMDDSDISGDNMNRVIAALFCFGIEFDIAQLFKYRSVRPFRRFNEIDIIVQPCERQIQRQSQSNLSPIDAAELNLVSSFHQFLHKMKGVNSASISNEIAVIPEAFETLGEKLPPEDKNHSKPRAKNEGPKNNQAALSSLTIKSNESLSRQELEVQIKQMVVNATGYPENEVTLEMKIFDDLNINSLKAGHLVRTFLGGSKKADGDHQKYINASLAELVTVAAKKRTVAPTLDSILILISEQTGFPKESLSTNQVLSIDLNMTAQQIEQLTSSICEQLDRKKNFNPKNLSEMSIEGLVRMIDRLPLASGHQSEDISSPYRMLSKYDAWSRYFLFHDTEQSRQLPPNMRDEDQWKNSHILILSHHQSTHQLCEILSGKLRAGGGNIHVIQSDSSKIELKNMEKFTHFINILPKFETVKDNKAKIASMFNRLLMTANPTQADTVSRRKTVVNFIQFGGGRFGSNTPPHNLESIGTLAFAKCLFLERSDDLKIRVLDFSIDLETEFIVDQIIEENKTIGAYQDVGFDHNQIRRVSKISLYDRANLAQRKSQITKSDVFLVTGGGRGITAECALALAKKTGVKLILMGSTSLTISSVQSKVLQQTLARFEMAKVDFRYYSCDITQKDSFERTIRLAENEFGKITGVIHGAGQMVPIKAHLLNLESVLNEISAKALGALNIVDYFQNNDLRYLIGFTSLNSYIGTPGNCSYGFSNEILSAIFRQYGKAHATTQVVNMGWSLWTETGMGHRFGSAESFELLGNLAGDLTTHQGTEKFCELATHSLPTTDCLISGRVAFPTFEMLREKLEPASQCLFLNKPIFFEPRVELVFNRKFTLSNDRFLKDHVFSGVCLIPMVFLMEIAVEASQWLISSPHIGYSFSLQNIESKEAIVVDENQGVLVEVRAFMEDKGSTLDSKIAVEIRTSDQTNVAFKAQILVSPTRQQAPKNQILDFDLEKALPVELRNFYGRSLFVSGPFAKMRQAFIVSENRAVASVEVVSQVEATSATFNVLKDQEWLLQDPYCRDAYFQVANICIPQYIGVPIKIDGIETYLVESDKTAQMVYVSAELQDLNPEQKMAVMDITIYRANGSVRERIKGYTCRLVNHHPMWPTSAELNDTNQYWHRVFSSQIEDTAKGFSVQHEIIHSAVAKLETHRSINHLYNESGSQICQIQDLVSKSLEEWTQSCGKLNQPLIEKLLSDGLTIDEAGCLIWICKELVIAREGGSEIELSLLSRKGRSYQFGSGKNPSALIIGLLPDRSLQPQKVLAFWSLRISAEGVSSAA